MVAGGGQAHGTTWPQNRRAGNEQVRRPDLNNHVSTKWERLCRRSEGCERWNESVVEREKCNRYSELVRSEKHCKCMEHSPQSHVSVDRGQQFISNLRFYALVLAVLVARLLGYGYYSILGLSLIITARFCTCLNIRYTLLWFLVAAVILCCCCFGVLKTATYRPHGYFITRNILMKTDMNFILVIRKLNLLSDKYNKKIY